MLVLPVAPAARPVPDTACAEVSGVTLTRREIRERSIGSREGTSQHPSPPTRINGNR